MPMLYQLWCALAAHIAKGDQAVVGPRGEVLLQVGHAGELHGRSFQPASYLPPAYSWSASPFGGCIAGQQTRIAKCMNMWTGASVSPAECKLAKPELVKKCKGKKGESSMGSPTVVELADDSDIGYEWIGCVGGLGAADPAEEMLSESGIHTPASTGDDHKLFDYYCMEHRSEVRCQLPFYRMLSNAMSPTVCFEFCLGKGLDLFGLVANPAGHSECRCGASLLNKIVWSASSSPAQGLLLNPRNLIQDQNSPVCTAQLFRFGGHFQSGGVPSGLVKLTPEDDKYVTSVVQGSKWTDADDVPQAHGADSSLIATGVPAPAPAPSLVPASQRLNYALAATAQGSAGRRSRDPPGWTDKAPGGFDYWDFNVRPGWERNCWPDNCQGTRSDTAWYNRTIESPFDEADVWEEYVVVPYTWTELVAQDETRKEAFRAATVVWNENTCIRFVESPEIATVPKPYVRIGNWSRNSCSSCLGLGHEEHCDLNMGHCRDMRGVGSLIHELGHVLGLNHEQARPDTIHEHHGHGPFMRIGHSSQWSNNAPPPTNMRIPGTNRDGSFSTNMYTGSADDGPGDPYVGYKPYDFESIMHYGTSGFMWTAIDESKNELTGNRDHPTALDFGSVHDIYQCKPKTGPRDPPPPPPPASCGWRVTAGQCVIDQECCAMSPNYPGRYYNMPEPEGDDWRPLPSALAVAACTIEVTTTEDVSIRTEYFNTETWWDGLTINGVKYSGTYSPHSVRPVGTIEWMPDNYGPREDFRWKLCLGEPFTTTTTTTPLPQTACGWTVRWGDDCVIADDCCAMSVGFGVQQTYASGGYCQIVVDTPAALTVVAFDTERGYDKLTVNDIEYSGSSPLRTLSGVTPHGGPSIAWRSDSTVQTSGWKVCMGSSDSAPATN